MKPSPLPPDVPTLVEALQAALAERQALLARPDMHQVDCALTALGQRVRYLLDRLEALVPPAAEGTPLVALEGEDTVPGVFDSFVDRDGPQRRAS
jgi:hypothetical protein